MLVVLQGAKAFSLCVIFLNQIFLKMSKTIFTTNANLHNVAVNGANLYTMATSDIKVSYGGLNFEVEQEAEGFLDGISSSYQTIVEEDSDATPSVMPKFLPYMVKGCAIAGNFEGTTAQWITCLTAIKSELSDWQYVKTSIATSSKYTVLFWGVSNVNDSDFYDPQLTSTSTGRALGGLLNVALWATDAIPVRG